MNSSPYIKNVLKDLSEKISNVIKSLSSTNLSPEGDSLIHAIAIWLRRVSFINEFNYDVTLLKYLDYLIADAQVLIIDNENLLGLLDQFRFFYTREYAIHFN
ncbi:hypothetical protein ENUP19_0342G0009 [Entamoeba nuttalli]|uniref:Uncharacterized protein n=2 Tax=Entamoeba nuttalli TaxID=412467 RepID=K2HNV1_ENTNP|nr:hypothetical protein ENU1_193730 [Entamoeba nuttalli P19]EKE37535.1 hypothetical protein ENU1_193730 [Entamoeba nuttalli P19]|eukprot:XP_008860130.1 hypothetical protein ENU1_193730 [Entamoeba nuttalli P19]